MAHFGSADFPHCYWSEVWVRLWRLFDPCWEITSSAGVRSHAMGRDPGDCDSGGVVMH